MRRRDFLAGAGAAVLTAATLRAQETDKLARMCVLSWSFRNLWARTRDRGIPAPAKDFDILDYPEMIADRYGIHNVEVQSMYFPSTDSAYLREFATRLKRAKSRLVDICLEFDDERPSPTISATDPQLRQHAIDLSLQWIDHAAYFGCHSIMPNQGTVNPADPSLTIDALKTLKAHADPKNVRIILEDRGVRSGTADVLAKIIKESGIYANPDIGNFPDRETTMQGLRELFPLADGICHVKYNPSKFDLASVMQIAKNSGFKGLYSIETETNNGPDPYRAVQQVLDQVLPLI